MPRRGRSFITFLRGSDAAPEVLKSAAVRSFRPAPQQPLPLDRVTLLVGRCQ
jgi:hypothetical protein